MEQDRAGTIVEADDVKVDLKDPVVAAFLAWLIPGAGHLYQGRVGKGLLFMTCILGTFFYGLFLGDGRVVYASWRPMDKRFPYFCQVGAGLPALPAVVQAYRTSRQQQPLFGGFMAPPALPDEFWRSEDRLAQNPPDELAALHYRLNRYFDLGTLYTMVAGLLNVLVIYDAWGGPMRPPVQDDRKKRKKKSSDDGSSPPPPGS
jgi:uncharacterized protein DUF6677